MLRPLTVTLMAVALVTSLLPSSWLGRARLALVDVAPTRATAQPGAGTERTALAPMGPLRVHPTNPRYFADPRGRAVYLTGSHNWNSFQDRGPSVPPPTFNFEAYLDVLERQNHNFIRLWVWEHAQWAPWTADRVVFRPLAFRRTGPGRARDGDLRFDLHAFDQAYFDRLRARVVAARDRGIYVAVMLFEGWSIDTKGKTGNPWPGHPFHRDNNVNGIDGDPDRDGEGRETHMLAVPAVGELQRAYIRKVVDTLNDLDNVLWEVSNESHTRSTEWQYDVIRFIKAYEATLPAQHPVGMTAQYPGGKNGPLFESPADWISPVHEAGAPYRSDPPPASGEKVVVSDTDHLWGIGGDGTWVWKTFTRGLHPIYMDPFDNDASGRNRQPSLSARRAMGQTLVWTRRMDLAAMTPRPDLASSRYCLANPGQEYLVYVPNTSAVTVDLSAVDGRVAVEWFDPATGQSFRGGPVRGGGSRTLSAPFTGERVLYLKRV
jgi:hypothetical protein